MHLYLRFFFKFVKFYSNQNLIVFDSLLVSLLNIYHFNSQISIVKIKNYSNL